MDASRGAGSRGALVVAPHELEVPEYERRIIGDAGRVLDPRERVERDRRLGGRGSVDGSGEGDVLLVADVDEGDHDGVALLQEGVGELHHGHQVADGETGVKNHGLLMA